ncbi:MAG: acyl-CoA dehydratase activase [Chloroflexota bacterium]
MITLGVDAGTRATKAVLADSGSVLASVIVPCGRKSAAATAGLARDMALGNAGVAAGEVASTAATGMYADRVAFASRGFPEGVCLARAMYQLNPAVHSVLDVGSVRALAIKCREGKLTGFAVNDRCASGTGAFVEALAAYFKMPVEELGEVALKATEPADFLNTCAVFVESEALSLLMSGKKPEDLIAGALRGFASRVLSVLLGMGVEMEAAMVGGLARNRALVKAIGESLGAAVFVPGEPETTLALGAALLAAERG